MVNRRFGAGEWVVGVRLGPKSRAGGSGRLAFCPFLSGLVGRSSAVPKTPGSERHELHPRVSPRRRAVVKWRFGAGDWVVGVRLGQKGRAWGSGRPAFCPFLGGLVVRWSAVPKTRGSERHELHPRVSPRRRAVVNRRFKAGYWVMGVRLKPKSRAWGSGRPAFCPFLGGVVRRSSAVPKTPGVERHELHARVCLGRRTGVNRRYGAGDWVVGVRLGPKVGRGGPGDPRSAHSWAV